MILACQNISKSFGTDEILKEVSFHIEENEKAAVVGINGAGKSTLLKIIMQQENADTGEVVLAKNKTIGYLAQHQDISGEKDYCSKEYRVFSTDDHKMETWTHHGVSVRNTKDNSDIPFSPDVNLYAPDCVYCKGKYYR